MAQQDHSHSTRLRRLVRRISEHDLLLILSLLVGVACGAAAVLLKLSIHGLRQLLSGVAALSGGRWLLLVLPGVGMLLSLILVRYLVRDKIGHGVTKVLVAVSRNESRIKPHNMWSSLVTSALTIGFGGSVGAEAPIVYTGAAIGSNAARAMGMSYRSMTILLGCGAAGAVAGIFNAPLAGVLFTLEILLFNISMSSMLPLLLSTLSATVVSRLCLGPETQFSCQLAPFAMGNLPFYLLLGVVCGFFSLYFLRTTLALEDRIARHLRSPWIRWAVCALGVGGLVFLFPPLYGEGYETLGDLLNARFAAVSGIPSWLDTPYLIPVFFLLVLLLKVFSMSFTNAGGGVGGTFGPTLFVGALAGFVLVRTLNISLGSTGLTLPEQNFVLVGMAGLMAGVMQAPMTAIFLIAEISGGYDLLVPLILTASVAYGTTRIFEKYSIYTKRIARSGDLLTHDSDQAVLTLLRTSDLIESDFSTISIDATLGQLVEVVEDSRRNIFPVIDSKQRFQGYVILEDIRHAMFKKELYDTMHVYNFMKSAPAYVHADEKMDSVMKKFEATGAWNLPVVGPDRRYLGFVSKSKIFSAYRDRLRLVSEE